MDCQLIQPIEIVPSITDVWKFRDDMEKEILNGTAPSVPN